MSAPAEVAGTAESAAQRTARAADASAAAAAPQADVGHPPDRPHPVAERGYWALREDCGIVDASDRGKLALSGAGALEFLNGQVTNEVAGLAPGEGRYAAFLTHKGKMLGDVRILATESEVLLDTERVALQALFDMIRHFKLGYDVETHKRTVQCGLFYVRGTRARAVIAEMVPPNTLPEPETAQSHSASTIAGRAVRLIGEGTAAVDVLMAAEDAVKKASEHGMRTLEVEVAGPGSGRESALRSLGCAGQCRRSAGHRRRCRGRPG